MTNFWLLSRLTRSNTALEAANPVRSATIALLEETEPLTTRMTVWLIAGIIIIGIVFAARVHVDRIVTGTGHINSVQPTIVVQSLDRAVITAINVREGDRVRAGQILATLDPTFVAADVAQIQVQIESLNAEIARLQAEHDGQPIDLRAIPLRYEEIQHSLWEQRQAEFQERVRSYDSKIAQSQATIEKYRQNAENYQQQLKVLQDIEEMRRTLFNGGQGSRLNLLETINRRLEVSRTIEYETNALTETEHALDATKADRETFLRQWQGQIDTDLVKHRTERDAAEGQLAKASRHHDLIDLRASADAIVLHIANLSVGSVLQESTQLFTLVPTASPLEAEIHIDASDIGFVRPGDPVALKIESFNYLEHGYVEGHLRVLSADTFATAGDGNDTPVRPYYKGYITLDKVKLHDVPKDFALVHGMPVTADLKIGQRTLLSYLVTGALRSVGESMREP
ncbi:MAG: HlyD family type I secretion periplasmic adaptor subunit [Dongiaceae bacterium]